MKPIAVTSQGRVTIPKELRKRLGIRRGSRVEFVVVGDRVELRLMNRAMEAVQSGYGMLRTRRRAAPADIDVAPLIRR